MNTISDRTISIEEANMALKEMSRQKLNEYESLETIDSYVNRVRTLSLSELVDYVIDTKLTEIQKQIIRDCWFENISPDKTAEKLGISRRAVYLSREKAQEALRDYLEPLIMYFGNLPSADITPAVIDESLAVSKARKKSAVSFGSALKSIRLAFGAGTALAAEALGISEKELIRKEKMKKEPALSELKKLSRAFGAKITLEFNNGNGEIRWVKH